jgi:hypothetical protein
MVKTFPLLERLREGERAKRLLLLGAVGIFYGGGWLLFAFHASRIGEAESTVLRVTEGPYYTVTHLVDGVEYMASPGRIPDSLGRPPVGSRLHCYYYQNDPRNAFFDRRHHPWPQPIPLAVLAIGIAACAEGLRQHLRSRERPPEEEASGDSPAAPLEIPLAKMTKWGFMLGGPFLVPTTAIAVLSTWLAWGTRGDMITGFLVFVLGTHGAMLACAVFVFYSSGLVFDSARGLLHHGWGLTRPWLRTYRPLAALLQVETELVPGRGAREHKLVLRFQDDSVWKHHLGYRLEQPFKTQESIKQYLRDTRP